MTGLRTIDLDTLNSATKYPSIPTYHALDPKNGGLLDTTVPFSGRVVLTEKLDGSNARVITLPDGGYVLGSREELLYAKGDLIGNPAQGIVGALRAVAERLTPPAEGVRTLYLEVYGGKITGASRQYTGHRAVGHRMFDTADVPAEVLDWPRHRVSAWRDGGGPDFLGEDALAALAAREGIDLVPRLGTVDGGGLPTGIEETQGFLADHLPATRAALDDDAGRRPEGIVLRTADRSAIAKARFQDYARMLKRRR
ncbi:RNA ligase family protein [Nocardiopsis mangrovi]|uniref:RNA ligase family protein n=1 Tax=Nocardiopsis mangrovi TaxID=1179818 RepID=A0ABV9E4L4_9ACTN